MQSTISLLCLWKTSNTLLFTGTNNISTFVYCIAFILYFSLYLIDYFVITFIPLCCHILRIVCSAICFDTQSELIEFLCAWYYKIAFLLSSHMCLTALALFFLLLFRSSLALMFFAPSDRAVQDRAGLPSINACSLFVSPSTTNNLYQKCLTLS